MKTKKILTLGIICSILFTLIVAWSATGLGSFRETLLPDQGASWYYWKLPNISLWAAISMWLCYGLHQILAWYFIYKLQQDKHNYKTDKIGKYNAALLIVNSVFIFLHVFQTRLFYDGLAQFVPVASSQYSVIIMLVFMLILLNGQRGLFFGKKVPLSTIAVSGVAKTHGYFIAWAAVYTFWFHPMENTWGHLLGFFYMFLLMLQMSLAYTKIHTNLKWVTVLEVFVTLHGTVIALQAGQTLWSMFLFGFAMMFIITQMYGVVRLRALRIIFTVVYIVAALILYSGVLGTGQEISQIHQIFWIPIILYGLVFAIIGLYHITMRALQKNQKTTKKEMN
ncbi:hypothetical protein Q5O14_11420 [Eubacteriaceae bacterium ES2]|nr:hypothetical protein Q5O14_11420 [Eubacteriaceae bacterium ES2]